MKELEWELKELPWLLPCPVDFASQAQSISEDSNSHSKGERLKILSNHQLNLNQLTKLGNIIKRELQKEVYSLNPLKQFEISILSNSTVDLFIPALSGAAARHGLALNAFVPSYDQIMQEVIDPNSILHTQKKDAVLLALDYRGLPSIECELGILKEEDTTVERLTEYIATIQSYIKKYSNVPLIIQTIAKPPVNLFGNFEQVLSGTVDRIIDRLNVEIVKLAKDSGDYILDIANLAGRVGLDNWHSPKQWNMYKLSFDQKFVPLYVDHISRLIATIVGFARKCLVLDLDNTLWGGVIGEDGLEGIQLGQGDPAGESFIEIQKMALALRKRGIVLAVCSKNEMETARLPFQKHPEMILKEDHISVFVANWQDKASNLEYIAKTLNIGIDSLVLLDDNPAERAQVRQALPMVALPELPSDSAYYPQTLFSAGYFETVTFSKEDLIRATQYQEDAKRHEFRAQAKDLTSYLEYLEMKMSIDPFDQLGLPRIVQLISKSNQFNLTTQRYTEHEIRTFIKNSQIATFQVRLADRFGDYGMISVLICKLVESGIWEIDTWLMSCRVLGRCVEQAMLNQLIQLAKKRDINTIQGYFKPSGKNELVRDHYEKLGFTPTGIEGKSTLWQLNVGGYVEKKVAIQVTSLLNEPSNLASVV